MMLRILPVVLLIACCGCRAAIKDTLSNIRIGPTGPLQTVVTSTSHVAAPDVGPLTETVLSGGACADKIALIELDGPLLNDFTPGPYSAGENPVALFAEKLAAAKADPAVRAVLLRVNSPGGTVGAAELMIQELTRFRAESGKPVIASILEVGAGSALHLAACGDGIFAMPGSVVGGLGVSIRINDAVLAAEKLNTNTNVVQSGKYLTMGSSMDKPAQDEIDTHPQKVLGLFKDMVTEYHRNFAAAIRVRRPALKSTSGVWDGRVMTPETALREGLIDRIGTLQDATAEAARVAGLPGEPRLIAYGRASSPPRTIYAVGSNKSILASAFPISHPALDLPKTPQFFYMWAADPNPKLR